MRSRVAIEGQQRRAAKAFFMRAMVAIRVTPIIKVFAARLRTAGISKMLIIGIAMKRLWYLVFEALESGQLFIPHSGFYRVDKPRRYLTLM